MLTAKRSQPWTLATAPNASAFSCSTFPVSSASAAIAMHNHNARGSTRVPRHAATQRSN